MDHAPMTNDEEKEETKIDREEELVVVDLGISRRRGCNASLVSDLVVEGLPLPGLFSHGHGYCYCCT